MAGGYTLRLDPWAPEYEGSIQLTSDDGGGQPVDAAVEQARWEAIRPADAARPRVVAFVDGVRRVEHRLLVTRGTRTAFGLLGSYGVGAVRVEGVARVSDALVGRAVVVSGGEAVDPFVAVVGDGRLTVLFEPESVPENDPAAPLAGLQAKMRRSEAGVAERIAAEVDVVFQDGPLTFVNAARHGCVVGFVKRLQQQYLEPAAEALLPRLDVGERTPLFLIPGKAARYSWYQRIAFGRAIESALAGVVRLEAPAERGLAEAIRLADLSAREIPRFASSAARDPRAPQNLHPIGGLESRLKHLLGDPLLLRRAIEASLHSEVTA
ncbi:MAG: hypothetical protein U0599_19235 [Vicinamibacteria bacterium]